MTTMTSMTSDELILSLEDMVEKAMSFPWGKSVVDTEKFENCIKQLRESLPIEIRKAKEIVTNRTQILEDARKNADIMLSVAEEKKKRIIAESEIVRAAQEKAAEILDHAKTRERDIRNTTNAYVEDLLKQVDETLVTAINDVRKSRNNYKNAANKVENKKSNKA